MKCMCNMKYFKAAYHNWDVANRLIQFYHSDELYINDAAYNLQQCVEKVLKAYLECKGVTVPPTHNIYKLIAMSKNNGSAVKLTDWIEQNQYEIESWESDTRYNFDFVLEIGRIQEGIREVKHFLKINGLDYTLEDAITPEVKEALLQLLPSNLIIQDDFELNCYYHIFKRKLETKK